MASAIKQSVRILTCFQESEIDNAVVAVLTGTPVADNLDVQPARRHGEIPLP